uniref:Uncharacterized protein n=1 Tax=Oryza rufipogon TaxID=4529 RepID=A0A0E0NW00_ORYRU
MTRLTDGGSPATDACCLIPAISTAEVRVLLLLEPVAIVVVVFSGIGIGIGVVVVFSSVVVVVFSGVGIGISVVVVFSSVVVVVFSSVGMRRLRRRRAPRSGCVWGECGVRMFATSAAEVEVEG